MHCKFSTKLERKKRQIEGRKGKKNRERIRERKRNKKERGRGGKERKERWFRKPSGQADYNFPKVAATMSPLTTVLLQYNFHTHPLRCEGLCFLPLNPGRLMAIVEVPLNVFMANS